MFYSQFILAKKGPLGTIWIAAHLERKLKKNQVADTDIGVSVDSILFPEVPIALRLSSHLLLGVVRIYSRKVNYLFHDCSEALLKAKQAFRSTAVDLPPEESTAPYHSITLPETFDLDDFELPDSAVLHSNFDDRHVSTREQITLQDTLDRSGYSTSQFGLDERFGDGDASQIGLDLDEVLLLDNNLTLQDASVLDGAIHQGEGATDLTKMVIEEGHPGGHEDTNDETSKELSELLGNTKLVIEGGHHGGHEATNDEGSKELSELLGSNRGNHVLSNVENVHRNVDSSHRLIFNIQTPDLNEVFLPDDHDGGPPVVHDIDMDFDPADPPSPEFNQSANFPSTPGLLDEAIEVRCQELPASIPQNKSPDTAPEIDKLHTPINQEVECTDVTNGPINVVSASPKSTNLAQLVSSPTSVLGEPKPDSDVPINGDGQNHVEPKGLQSTSSTLVLTEPVTNSLVPQFSGEPVAAPGSASTLREADTLHTEITSEKANGLPVSMDYSLLSGIASTSVVQHEDTTRISNLDQGCVEDANSCQTSNFSAFSSAFHLRPCTSESNQANLISSWNMVQERAQGERTCNLETPMVDREIHISGYSADPQGFHSVISTETNLGVHQNSNNVFMGLQSGVSNPIELSTYCNPKDVQSCHWNFFSSSEFSEPERMRFAASGNINMSNDLGQQTIEKGVIVSDGSVDRISNLSGQKRHLVDITPNLQSDISPKTSGIPRKKQNIDYIPNDDDLLASILVGRMAPGVRIGPTPPLPKPPSLKRPRLTAKAGLPKRRKVLLDDSIVLHADAIRQQLINTEDIRRIRRKAPCTRPEIWRIQKSSLEDDIFCEPIFTGVSDAMNRLLTQTYDLAQNIHSQVNAHYSGGESSKEAEHSKSSVFRDNDGQEMTMQNVLKRVGDEMQVASVVSELIGVESHKNAVPVDGQEQLESPHDLHHVDLPHNTISREELDILGHSGIVPVTHAASNSGIEEKRDDFLTGTDHNSLNKEFQTSQELLEVNNNLLHVADGTSFRDSASADHAGEAGVVSNSVPAAIDNATSLEGKDFSNAKTTTMTVEDMGADVVNLDCHQDGPANHGKDDCGGVSVTIPDRFVVKIGQESPTDHLSVIGSVDASVPGMDLTDNGPVTIDCQATNDSESGKVMDEERPVSDLPGGERPPINLFPVPPCTESERNDSESGKVMDEERPVSDLPGGERPPINSFPVPPCTESERVPSAVGENSCLNLDGGLDVASNHMEFAATRESSDFCGGIDDIDTDFLNVDDDVDEYEEEANIDAPNTEEAETLENSGWSSRTRGVARYLKNMFDQESGRGRKSLAIDHLLAAKTRKEASRMFFETLVLKTKDFIHVEQENPFDCIIIKPRIKILKSEF